MLELLPTHLTALQIAARLFVTKNTVKSAHAPAVHEARCDDAHGRRREARSSSASSDRPTAADTNITPIV